MNQYPRIVVERPTFRIVAVEDQGQVGYVLETPDGCDALGVERWRDFKLNSGALRELFGYLCQVITKGADSCQ